MLTNMSSGVCQPTLITRAGSKSPFRVVESDDPRQSMASPGLKARIVIAALENVLRLLSRRRHSC